MPTFSLARPRRTAGRSSTLRLCLTTRRAKLSATRSGPLIVRATSGTSVPQSANRRQPQVTDRVDPMNAEAIRSGGAYPIEARRAQACMSNGQVWEHWTTVAAGTPPSRGSRQPMERTNCSRRTEHGSHPARPALQKLRQGDPWQKPAHRAWPEAEQEGHGERPNDC